VLAATAATTATLLLAGADGRDLRAQEQRLVRVALARSLSAPALWGIGPFAAKYGLRTENVQATTNAEQLRSLQSGVEVGSVGYQSPGIMAEQNIGNVKVISGLYVGGQNLIMRKGVDLRSWQDLEGKRIGRPPGTFAGILFTLAAEANNVDLSKVNLVTTTAVGITELQALKNGDLDGFILWSPTLDRAVVEGYGYYPPCCDIGSTKEFGAGNQLLGANTEFLKDRKTVVSFLRAFLEAHEHYTSHPDELVSLIGQYTGVSKEILTAALQRAKWDVRADIQNAINIAKQGPKFGFTKADMSEKVASYFDLSFLSEATGRPVEQLSTYGR
jgi:ABC-type nitrate/sulfonate/bicarbonate transport system substrate-binding protein